MLNSKNLIAEKYIYAICFWMLMVASLGWIAMPQTFAKERVDDPESKLEEPLFCSIYDLHISDAGTAKAKLEWSVKRNVEDGFYIYRRSKDKTKRKKIADVESGRSNSYSYTDSHLIRGLTYTYEVVPYYEEDGDIREDYNSSVKDYQWRFATPQIKSVQYKSKKRIRICWNSSRKVNGYEIALSTKRNSGYKTVKKGSSDKTEAYINNFPQKRKLYIKIRFYTKDAKKHKIYSSYSKAWILYDYSIETVNRRIRILKKRYPSGRYWNHVGKNSNNIKKTTKRPCNHLKNGMRDCNHYLCPNKVQGYQCYGFAWLMSDSIYGRKAKIKEHKSFKKARVGDVVRYNNHSIIIIEKKPDYVRAGECNAGGTCVISWGRKITKRELRGARYYRRY